MRRAQILNFHTLSVAFLCTLFFTPLFTSAQTTPATQSSYDTLLNQIMQQRQQDATQAALNQNNTMSNYLDVKVNPPTPAPNIPVTISIDSYLTDLYKATISWSLNGTVLLRGTGKTSFTFQNGPSGQTTTVSLLILTNKGETISRDFSFTPVGVDIMWEADTYTPPFYRGKALLSPQANVRIVAVPSSTSADDPLGGGNLVYNWKQDDTENTSASGYGKNSFSFAGPTPFKSAKISLDVSTIDDSAHSSMQIYLPQVTPFIVFYKKDPLLGTLYNSPLGDETSLDNKELTLDAAPYYFSNEYGEFPSLRYSWSVNGKEVQSYGRTIALRNDTGTQGTSLVTLAMRGIVNTFQSSNKSLRIKFTGDSSPVPIF